MDSIDLDATYHELSERLGAPPNTEAWKIAIENRTVDEYHADVIDIDELANEVDRIRDTVAIFKAVTRSHRIASKTETKPDFRMWARGLIFGIEASRSRDVAAFRKNYLPNGLVIPADVGQWILSRVQEEPAPDPWVSAPEQALIDAESVEDLVRRSRRFVHEITWSEPTSEGTRRHPIHSQARLWS